MGRFKAKVGVPGGGDSDDKDTASVKRGKRGETTISLCNGRFQKRERDGELPLVREPVEQKRSSTAKNWAGRKILVAKRLEITRKIIFISTNG